MTTVLAITGHRPDKLGGFNENNPIAHAVKRRMREVIESLRPKELVIGMAQGVDQWAGEIAIELEIPYIACVPFVGQESIWPKFARARYHRILEQAMRTHIVSNGGYTPTKMHDRNIAMVNLCSTLLAVWNGSSGGTKNCVTYANSVNRPVYRINPKELETSVARAITSSR